MKLTKAKNVWTDLLEPNKLDSVWYAGEVVEFDFDETVNTDRYTFKYVCSAEGDVEIVDNNSDDYMYDKNGYVPDREDFLAKHNIHNDDDLNNAIQNDLIRFEYNNWFEERIIATDKETGEEICITDRYDSLELIVDYPFDIDDNDYDNLVEMINEWKHAKL